MDKKTIKELAISLVADFVEVAATDRFVNSPTGHARSAREFTLIDLDLNNITA